MPKVAPAAGTGTQTASTYAVVPRAVLDDQSLSDAAVRLFAVLDARVTTKASQQIRQDTLAEQLGWSRSKVQRALGHLVTAGYVTVQHTARSSRVSVTNASRVRKDRAAARNGTRGTVGTTSGDASNLKPHTPSSVKSEAADASNLKPLYRNTSLRNTNMTAQPRAARASVPIISEPKPDWLPDQSGSPDPKTKTMPADDAPEIMPDRVLVDYLTAIWRSTGHHLDRNHLTEGVLTRIHQHGTSAQETAARAAEQLAAKGSAVRNPAGYLVRVVLPAIADQTLTAPPAPKPTPTPPAVAEIAKAARCEHGAEIGRCALCRQARAATATCMHGQTGDCATCRIQEQQHRLTPEPVTDIGCGHPERRPDGKCLGCAVEAAKIKRSLAMAGTA